MKWFGNSLLKRTRKAYESKIREAMEAQRMGDIQATAARHVEAEMLLERVKQLENKA